jgi:hypothetical protein
MILLRFMARLLLVPLAGAAAITAAVLTVCLVHWGEFVRIVESEPDAPDTLLLALFSVGPRAAMNLAFGVTGMLLPAAFGALIAEALALRSWMFHSANGAVASLIGWLTLQEALKPHPFTSEPTGIVGAGLAAGFVYWLVAGWSAGFWRPVFSHPDARSRTASD